VTAETLSLRLRLLSFGTTHPNARTGSEGMRYLPNMAEIPFVKPEEAALAREIEERLSFVRGDAGILFVGVSVRPTVAGEAPLYHVWIGCDRSTQENLMHHLVANICRAELDAGVKIEVEAHRGVVRP
jgi:hypothetical protein